MKFQCSERAPTALDLTPMLDVVFLLLIFFMVSTRFDQLKEVPIELPQVGSGQTSGSQKNRRLQMRVDGQLFLDGTQVDRQGIDKALDGAQRVVLSADEAVPHGRFMEVLTELRALPLEAVTVEVREQQPPN